MGWVCRSAHPHSGACSGMFTARAEPPNACFSGATFWETVLVVGATVLLGVPGGETPIPVGAALVVTNTPATSAVCCGGVPVPSGANFVVAIAGAAHTPTICCALV